MLLVKLVKDISGNIYNEIKVVERDLEKELVKNDGKKYWKCICHCGNIFSPSSNNLKSGNTKSCGCMNGGKGKTKNNKFIKWETNGEVTTGITNREDRFLIDTEDLPKVKDYCWRLHKKGYIVANKKDTSNSMIGIHRVIMNPKNDELVDHRNWNKLDNRKQNLRVCNRSENNVNIHKKSNNTSGYTGVERNGNNWKAEISFNNKKIYLGTYKTIEDAVKSRNRAEKIIHKEFNGEINRKDFIKMINQGE